MALRDRVTRYVPNMEPWGGGVITRTATNTRMVNCANECLLVYDSHYKRKLSERTLEITTKSCF